MKLTGPPKPNPAGRAILEDLQDSKASAVELTQIQLPAVREYLNADLFAFNWLVFGHTDLIQSVHGEICDILNIWGWILLKDGSWVKSCNDPDLVETDYRRLMIQIPREFFKTSVCTRANALWQICREPHMPVCITNERLANSKKWLGAIRDVVEGSVLFQKVYEDLLPPGVAQWDNRSRPRSWKWSDEALDFEGRNRGEAEYSISAMGIGAAAAGGHWPKMIKDDLISEDAAYSPTVMQQAIDWVDKSFYLERPAQKGMDLINCTRWAKGDVYDHLAETYDYTVYTRSALEDEDGNPAILGESIFPDKLSTKELRKQEARDTVGFWSQMMNHPKAGDDTSFELAWINRFSGPVERYTQQYLVINEKDFKEDLTTVSDEDLDWNESPPREVPYNWLSVAVILDPAQSRKSQKYAERYAKHGLVCAGYDAYGRTFVLETQAFRKDPKDTLEAVIDLALKWGTNRIAIEEVAFSEVYAHFLAYMLEKEEKYKNVHLETIAVEPAGRNKHMRVTSMIPFMKKGLFHVHPENCKQLLQELQDYPYGLTVDCVDALAYLPEVVQRPETPNEMEQSYIRRHLTQGPESGADPVTGY